MAIKHLVISGGGPIMIQTLGAIQHLEKNGFLNLSEIQSIYGTSAGGIVGTLICLKYDWETINDITIVYSANGDHLEFPADKCILEIVKVMLVVHSCWLRRVTPIVQLLRFTSYFTNRGGDS